MKNRAGYYKTNLSGQMAYSSFVPSPLPPNPPIVLSDETIRLLVAANSRISSLESISTHIPSMKLFISMYVRKEALMSSQIEGTQATLEDVLDPTIDENANRDAADVVNYVRATEHAIERMKTLPLSCRLIKEIHSVLMQDVRGQEKNPGEFRYSQNWIGGQGSTLNNARYIPPSPEDMEEAMSDLEKYINTQDDTDPLIRAALIHYQFETIHPFLDGNGRVGRLLIALYLMDVGLLTSPVLYISYFLKRNRVEYYDRMTEVRSSGSYEQWINFFLSAVIECAEDSVITIDELTALHIKNTEKILEMGRSAKSVGAVFQYLESNPIIEIRSTSTALGLSYNTVSNAVSKLLDAGILVKSSGNSRGRTFSYEEYLSVLRRGT
ncbi:MAG: Fic family protein [Firmicutes bacterium]|nr:Fic family protein [Bacillota bacterium]